MINRLPKQYRVEDPLAARSFATAAEQSGRSAERLTSRLLGKATASFAAHPVAAISVAVAAGMLLGKWIKR